MVSDQLALFTEPPPKSKRGGSRSRGAAGLLKALQRQGLDPTCIEPAARLVALLDTEPIGGRE